MQKAKAENSIADQQQQQQNNNHNNDTLCECVLNEKILGKRQPYMKQYEAKRTEMII